MQHRQGRAAAGRIIRMGAVIKRVAMHITREQHEIGNPVVPDEIRDLRALRRIATPGVGT